MMFLKKKVHSSASFFPGNSSGFTLLELLIAMALLSTMMAATFALYNMQHKMTYVEEDVVEVQQNLRMGMDSILRDLRYGGILVTGSTAPISAIGSNTGLNATDSITLNTASSFNTFARIDLEFITSMVTGVALTFTVASAEEVDGFSVGDIFRVINASEKSEPVSTYYTITATDRAVPSITAAPAVTAANVLFRRGFMIAKTGISGPDTFPNSVQYCVGPAANCGPAITTCTVGNCLIRIENGTPDNSDVIAENIQDLQILYILDSTTAEVDTTGTPANVRAVRINLTGVTVDTAALSGGAKTRSLTAVAKLRNR